METVRLGGPDGAQGGVIQLTMSELEKKKPTTDVIHRVSWSKDAVKFCGTHVYLN